MLLQFAIKNKFEKPSADTRTTSPCTSSPCCKMSCLQIPSDGREEEGHFEEADLNTAAERICSNETQKENMCKWCNKKLKHKTTPALKGHYTKRCWSTPENRAGSRTERAVLRNMQNEVQKDRDASEVYLEGSLLNTSSTSSTSDLPSLHVVI